MNIRILCVGKLKEQYLRDAVSEYTKRLGRYAKTEICEVADEKTPDMASRAECLQILEKEGERILSKIHDQDCVIALAIDGRKYNSEGFSQLIEGCMGSGRSTLDFVIGGSLGLSDRVLGRADYKVSFSDMTFPHQLMRVILSEQIYRAFKIMRKEPYHK